MHSGSLLDQASPTACRLIYWIGPYASDIALSPSGWWKINLTCLLVVSQFSWACFRIYPYLDPYLGFHWFLSMSLAYLRSLCERGNALSLSSIMLVVRKLIDADDDTGKKRQVMWWCGCRQDASHYEDHHTSHPFRFWYGTVPRLDSAHHSKDPLAKIHFGFNRS